MEETGAAIRARLRRAVPAAHHAGRSRLRLRFPRKHGARAGTGNPLRLPSHQFNSRLKTVKSVGLVGIVAVIMQGGGCNANEASIVYGRLDDAHYEGH